MKRWWDEPVVVRGRSRYFHLAIIILSIKEAHHFNLWGRAGIDQLLHHWPYQAKPAIVRHIKMAEDEPSLHESTGRFFTALYKMKQTYLGALIIKRQWSVSGKEDMTWFPTLIISNVSDVIWDRDTPFKSYTVTFSVLIPKKFQRIWAYPSTGAGKFKTNMFRHIPFTYRTKFGLRRRPSLRTGGNAYMISFQKKRSTLSSDIIH